MFIAIIVNPLNSKADSNFVINDGILTSYTGTDTTVYVPNGVISIGAGAFQESTSIVNVVLPDGIQKIHEGAFSLCTNLKSINIPEGVTFIGPNAFYKTNLESIALPSTLQYISFGCFIMVS